MRQSASSEGLKVALWNTIERAAHANPTPQRTVTSPLGWTITLPGALPHPGSVNGAHITFSGARLAGHDWHGQAVIEVIPDHSPHRAYPNGFVHVVNVQAVTSTRAADPSVCRAVWTELLATVLREHPQYRRTDQA